MEKMITLYRLFVVITLWACLMPIVGKTSDGQATIQGLIFISPSGKLEGDLVMRAAEVDVMLLPNKDEFDAELAAIRQSREPPIAAQLKTVRQAQAEFRRSTAGPPAEREKKSARLRQERAKLAELREAYENEVFGLIAKRTLAKTKTDSEGRFTFAGILPGRYLIYAHFEVIAMDIHYYWLLPVELERRKEIEVSLNKLNAVPLFQI
ncbi:MAG: carboxypeptidase-like regulatory domain-containing protein [Candidatus Binatia bacterium]